MRDFKYTRIAFVALVAITAVWALPRPISSVALAEVHSAGGAAELSHGTDRGQESALAPRAATSTKPVRWRIPYARDLDTQNQDCQTIVAVTGFYTYSGVSNAEVEFFSRLGTSKGLVSVSMGLQVTRIALSDNHMSFPPEYQTHDGAAGTGDFHGSAIVTADDPRITVWASLVCVDSGVTRITSLAAYPVGQTLEYFRAGLPVTSDPALGARRP